jgi:hypothetical protein
MNENERAIPRIPRRFPLTQGVQASLGDLVHDRSLPASFNTGPHNEAWFNNCVKKVRLHITY